MLAASSSTGGRNVADRMAILRMEEEAQHTIIDGSVIAKRFRSKAEKE